MGTQLYMRTLVGLRWNSNTLKIYSTKRELGLATSIQKKVRSQEKGQIIGYSGSTGGFVAPHLHYEIRDSETEHIINPLHFKWL